MKVRSDRSTGRIRSAILFALLVLPGTVALLLANRPHPIFRPDGLSRDEETLRGYESRALARIGRPWHRPL